MDPTKIGLWACTAPLILVYSVAVALRVKQNRTVAVVVPAILAGLFVAFQTLVLSEEGGTFYIDPGLPAAAYFFFGTFGEWFLIIGSIVAVTCWFYPRISGSVPAIAFGVGTFFKVVGWLSSIALFLISAYFLFAWWGLGGLIVGVFMFPLLLLLFPFIYWWLIGAFPWALFLLWAAEVGGLALGYALAPSQE